jgi:hypothetical protein
LAAGVGSGRCGGLISTEYGRASSTGFTPKKDSRGLLSCASRGLIGAGSFAYRRFGKEVQRR